MEIERIVRIVEELDELSNKFSDNEVIIACYLSIRYGTHTCKYYIDNTDLDKIHKEISKCSTLFDEGLNNIIDNIISCKELENKKLSDVAKEKIKSAFEHGDLIGLDEVGNQLSNIKGTDQETYNLITCIYKLNFVLGETEQKNYASKYNTQVQEIYSNMKAELFKRLEID